MKIRNHRLVLWSLLLKHTVYIFDGWYIDSAGSKMKSLGNKYREEANKYKLKNGNVSLP